MKYWKGEAGAAVLKSVGWRVVLFILSLGLYILLFLNLHGSVPASLTALAVGPVVVAGQLFGQRNGMLAGFFITLLNLLLLQHLEHATAAAIIIQNGGWASLVSLVLVGALVGQQHDVRIKLRAELLERQRINDSLHSAQTSLRNLITSNADGMLVVSQAGEIVFMNPAAKSLWQMQSGDQLWAQVAAYLTANQPGELSMVAPDGSQQVIEMRVAPTEWEGQPAWLAALRDITQRKQTELALRQSEERFRQFACQLRLMQLALDHVSNGVVITDPHQADNPVIYANPGFERLTGYSAAEVAGRNCRFLQRADRDQPTLNEVRAALREQRACQVLLRNYRKDGSSFLNELSIRPILNDEHQVVYYVGVQRDVTANLENQARLEYLSSHDTLTGLYNRSYFHAQAEQMVSDNQLPVAIMVADMDRLKQVNDHWGHAAGDSLLRKASELLLHAFRQQDVVARLGGDEFAVLMPCTNLYQSHGLLNLFYAYLEQHNHDMPERSISFSCGLAMLDEDKDVERVLHHADMAMYAEKARRKKDNS